jgi:hypothetical protein
VSSDEVLTALGDSWPWILALLLCLCGIGIFTTKVFRPWLRLSAPPVLRSFPFDISITGFYDQFHLEATVLGKARRTIVGQIRADFCGEERYRRWLFYLLLALPAVLLPKFDYMALNRERYSLGWPWSDMDILIGNSMGDGKILHFQPGLELLFFVPLWCYVASLALRAWKWAKGRPDWLGAFIQATLTSTYCVLLFCFFYGAVEVAWTWHVLPMDWAGLERACSYAWDWLPWLYLVGAIGIFAALFLDARRRAGFLWLTHFAFAVGFAFAFRHLAPMLTFQLEELNSLILYAQKEQLEPDSERPRIDARQLDKLEQIYARDYD